MKAATIILIALALALGAAMLVQHNKAVEQKNTDVAEKVELTNRLESTRAKFEEQERIAMYLQTNLTVREQELLSTSNSLLKTAADAAKAEMAKREARINELETQKDALDKQAVDLKSAIGNLEKSITDTEKKLAASEGDREFLLKELKRLQTEKAELERQFNDLTALRAQVSKLKDELSVARRLEWIRMGIYGQQAMKGAEKLMAGSPNPAAATNFNLNVELKQDGGAIVVPKPNPPAPAPAK